MTSNPVTFRRLQELDLDLLCEWFDKSHVKEWWNDRLTHQEIKSKYRTRIGDTVVVPYIVYLDRHPIGFIQYYHAAQIGEGCCPNSVAGTLGIDQFIGDEAFINLGYGTMMVRAFINKLFSESIGQKIITEVNPNNLRAIRCYVKVGFKFVKEMMMPDGLAYLMEFIG